MTSDTILLFFVITIIYVSTVVIIVSAERRITVEIRKLSKPDKKDTHDVAN